MKGVDNEGNEVFITVTVTVRPNERAYYFTDHLGSVRTTVDETGQVIGWDDFYPYGLTMPGRSDNSANPNDLNKFTRHEKDAFNNINLTYAGARYLDPELGIWLSIDPLAAKFPEWSPYNYTMGNPMNLIDPDGRAAKDWVEKTNGDIYWDDKATSQETTKEGEKYLGKNVIVATHNRDANGKEKINSAKFELYLESNKEGPTISISGNTVPADVPSRNLSTLKEGLYNADYASRSSKGSSDMSIFISMPGVTEFSKKGILPNTSGGTMTEIFLHHGNPGGKTLISRKGVGNQFSEGCQTTVSGSGSNLANNIFMMVAGKNFSGKYYLRGKE